MKKGTPLRGTFRQAAGIVLALVLLVSPALAQGVHPALPRTGPPAGPTFQSLLTRDLSNLTPNTRFSLNDKIHLYTIWTGLKGAHRLMVKWIRPDGKVQETTRFNFSVPEKVDNYRTWAWLSFKKSLLNISAADSKFVGPWKARLFMDDKLVAEYPFQVF